MLKDDKKLRLVTLVQALNIVSLLCCPDVSAHKRVWDNSFIPIYYSNICESLRPILGQDINKIIKHYKVDDWDSGDGSYWKEPAGA